MHSIKSLVIIAILTIATMGLFNWCNIPRDQQIRLLGESEIEHLIAGGCGEECDQKETSFATYCEADEPENQSYKRELVAQYYYKCEDGTDPYLVCVAHNEGPTYKVNVYSGLTCSGDPISSEEMPEYLSCYEYQSA